MIRFYQGSVVMVLARSRLVKIWYQFSGWSKPAVLIHFTAQAANSAQGGFVWKNG